MKKLSVSILLSFFTAVLCVKGQETVKVLQGELSEQKMQTPILINPLTINQLFALDASQSKGVRQFGPGSQLNAKRFWITNFKKTDLVQWQLENNENGDYLVDFLVNAKSGTRIHIQGPLNDIVFVAPESGWQRSRAQGILQLPKGVSKITLSVQGDTANIDLKGLELINQSQNAKIMKRVQDFKGDATWLKNAGYGIMTQIGGWSYPKQGDKKPWPGFAEDFDVKNFVGKIRDMGGKYIVWSATWSDYLFPAPIRSIAEVLPQRVSKRDMLGELISECQKYNIRVMLYYHLGHDHKDVLLAKGWKNDTEEGYNERQSWLNREIQIFKEIGNRYGKGLDAIFLDDGCVWYPADFEKLGAALKTGNPKRLICYNPWIGPSITPFQDFYCGEGFDGKETPYKINNGLIEDGPQKGQQLFGNFIFDGPEWGINKPNTVILPPNNWSADKIIQMTKRLEAEHYSVAFNLLVYENGEIGQASYEMLKEVAKKMKRGKWSEK
jgi:Alpha-L-fucosidase